MDFAKLLGNLTMADINTAVENYCAGLNAEKYLSANSTLGEVVRWCTNKAWGDAVLEYAGNTSHINSYRNDEGGLEKDDAIDLVSTALEQYFLGKGGYFGANAANDKKEFNLAHQKLATDLCGKFPHYNHACQTGKEVRNVGFTFGNAQKLINMTFKDILACCVHFGNGGNAFGVANFAGYFKNCHIPYDSIIYIFLQEISNPKSVVVPSTLRLTQTPWSKICDYKLYLESQEMVLLFNRMTVCDPQITVLLMEFVLWEECKKLRNKPAAKSPASRTGKIYYTELATYLADALTNKGFCVHQTPNYITVYKPEWKAAKLGVQYLIDCGKFSLAAKKEETVKRLLQQPQLLPILNHDGVGKDAALCRNRIALLGEAATDAATASKQILASAAAVDSLL